MKKIFSLLILLSLANCSGILKHKSYLLLVQESKNATFDGKVLQLNNVAKSTIYFSSKPERIAGHVSNVTLAKYWNSKKHHKSFKKDATISYYDNKGKADIATLELSNYKVKTNSVSYEAKVVKGKLPKNVDNVTLIIDKAKCHRSICAY